LSDVKSNGITSIPRSANISQLL